jgi:hypothetical protein
LFVCQKERHIFIFWKYFWLGESDPSGEGDFFRLFWSNKIFLRGLRLKRVLPKRPAFQERRKDWRDRSAKSVRQKWREDRPILPPFRFAPSFGYSILDV